ncbi:ubiquinol-cytochrome c reductase iron-sulfur subunit [Sulfurospirillum sp. MES]|uniref:ubiquinol-cytochrome c reductase iron-sulfur subunit n=1 Tax=Sulfurospirillum sp. MES TaxID=1565314 RepID=UPI0005422BBA|nr:ubiquinol-cytochrome c reductase iron-sulfur subunit [Sulfurospirillum sp. MES]KHG32854.1 MAG: ubiquinol cytochrome C oxidoreductase [Sulfurospirillum sp. MES]
MAEQSRRDFIGLALGGISTVGGVLALGAMKKSWDPLPSVQSAGFVSVDLSGMNEDEMHTVQWRGKPVFILRKSADTPSNDKRDIRIGEKRFVVLIGLCTHLGCIPSYEASSRTFKCACHGGVFDASGIQTFGPPPRPLDIPPFKCNGETIVLGEEGAEYQKMTKKA